jgi:hypothetical protein
MDADQQGKDLPVIYIRDLSGGVNFSTSQESIEDNEAWWMEGLMPIGPGNLQTTAGASHAASTGITGQTGAPSFEYTFLSNGFPYVFLVWKNSGDGYIGAVTGALTKVFVGTLTSGKTAACQWDKTGLLIVDPTAGYFDYGVSVAATLTALSNSVQSVTVNTSGNGYAFAPTVGFGGPGAGAAATAYIGVMNLVINAAGGGYTVGDRLIIPKFAGLTNPELVVTTVGGGGTLTGVSITSQGLVGVPLGAPTAVINITGSGAGATVTPNWGVVSIVVTARGTGYTAPPAVTLTAGGPPVLQGTATANVSGSLVGNAIAAYAGRAWIANGRTVTFTDAGAYASFVGSGSSFNIPDQTLAYNINALWVANNYLYIFGDTSVDVLSNVSITSQGIATFSRVNVSPAIGTNMPESIFSYYRSVFFANATGFYALSGASVDKISDKLDLLFTIIDFTQPICGCTVTINNILCAAFLVKFTDTITRYTLGSNQTMLCLYFKGRWFFSRQTEDSATPLVFGVMDSAIDVTTGKTNIYAFTTTPANVYNLFNVAAHVFYVLITKLYDMGKPMHSKQVLNIAAGFTNIPAGVYNDGFQLFTDNGASNLINPNITTTQMYNVFYRPTFTPDNSKYVSLFLSNTSTNTALVTRYEWFALQWKVTNPWQ